MVTNSNDFLLIVIDFQEKLAKHIDGINSIIESSIKLIKAFNIFELPVILTEQIKLGNTIQEIKSLVNVEPIQKYTFSCLGCEEFYRKIKEVNPKICILIGIEAHICILQTALDLIKEGYKVYVAIDCIGSRNKIDKDVAIQRLIMEGAKPATAEMIIYEILKSAKHEKFKKILEIVKG